MLNVRPYAQLLLATTLLATLACGKYNKKQSLRKFAKNPSEDATERESDWLKNISRKNEKGKGASCFQMDTLAQKFKALGDSAVTVQLVGVDFVKPGPSRQPGFKGQIFTALDGDLAAQIAKNFFTGARRLPLIQTVSAKSLLQSADPFGRLFRVVGHGACENTVTYANAPKNFNVLSQDRRAMYLQSAGLSGEVRIYEIERRSQLTVTVIQSIEDLVACGNGQQTTHYVRRTYQVTPTDTLRTGRLTTELAGLLKTYVYPELQVKKTNSKTTRLTVSPQLLDYMSQRINDNQDLIRVDCLAK